MPLISVSGFSKNEFTSDSGISVEFDGYLNVQPAISNVVTRRTLEAGFDTSDAVHNNATVLAVSIIITDTAQTILDKRAITNLPNILGTKFVQTHTKRQLDRLQEISNNREPISLKTKYGNYLGYFIENFNYPETDESALRITFNLVEQRTNAEEETTSNISDSIGLWS